MCAMQCDCDHEERDEGNDEEDVVEDAIANLSVLATLWIVCFALDMCYSAERAVAFIRHPRLLCPLMISDSHETDCMGLRAIIEQDNHFTAGGAGP